MSRFPSKLSDNSFGKTVVATRDLSPGTLVERFRGEVRRYEELPEAEIIYVISFEPGLWIIPEPNARFLNHSCDANCRFMDNGDVLTTREVGAGEELTIPYDFAVSSLGPDDASNAGLSLIDRLATALDIRPGERRLVALLTVHSFFVGIPRVATGTAVMALFLVQFDASNPPYVYIGAAAVIPLTGFVRLRLASRLSLTRLLSIDLAFVLGMLLLLRGALMTSPGAYWVAMILPVWYEVEWVLLNLEFWGLAGNLMNIRQGKRLFGLIGAGELIAGAIVGLLSPRIVAAIGTPNPLLISAVSVTIPFGILFAISRSFKLRPAPLDDDPEARRPRFRELMRSRYLGLLFRLVAVSYLGYYVVDNVFYNLAHARHPRQDELAGFLGVFWGMVSLLTIVSRTIAPGRVLSRYGLGEGLLALPVTIAAGISVVVLGGSMIETAGTVFWVIAVTKLTDQVLRESIDHSAMLVLYQPLPAIQRVRAQTAVEGIVGPIAGGVAGVALLFLIKVLDFGTMQLALVLLGVVIAWTAVAVVIRREYAAVLMNALARRRLTAQTLSLRDASSIAVLKRGLDSQHPAEVLYCLNTLEEVRHPSLDQFLARLLDHLSPEVRREALLRVERRGPQSLLPKVREMVATEKEPTVRASALRALAALGDPDDLESIMSLVDVPDASIREGARVALLRHGGIEGVLKAGQRLVESTRAEDPAQRAAGARLIGAVGVSNFYRPVLALLDDPALDVRRAAIHAARELENPRLWPRVLAAASDPRLRSAAHSALVTGGEAVLRLLQEAYEDAEMTSDVSTRRRLVRLASHIRSSASTAFLWRLAQSEDPAFRHSSLQALVLGGHRASEGQEKLIHQRVEIEVSEAVGTTAAIVDLSQGRFDASLVISSLEHSFDTSRDRILAWLYFIYPPESIQRARVNLGSRAAEKRAQAVELVDTMITAHLAEIVIPMIEDLEPRARLDRLRGRFPHPSIDPEQRLREIASGGEERSSWTRACALHAGMEAGVPHLEDAVRGALASTQTLIPETGAWAAARLDEPVAENGKSKRLVEAFGAAKDAGGGNRMLSTVEKVIILKGVSIFAETPDEVLAEVAPLLKEVEVAGGETIFEKGDMGSALFIVIDGRVRVHSGDKTLRELGDRDIFGEMAALDPEPRSASITAIESTRLFRLEQEALYELMADRIEVVRGVISVLCQRLRHSTPSR